MGVEKVEQENIWLAFLFWVDWLFCFLFTSNSCACGIHCKLSRWCWQWVRIGLWLVSFSFLVERWPVFICFRTIQL